MPLNAIGYCRLSTTDQSNYSLESQSRVIAEYCQRNNLNLLEVFEDNGESSYTFDRPDWKALEAFIKKKKDVQYLIISEHDRFSRNLAEALLKIKELFDKFGIRVLATSDRLDSDHADPSTYIMRAFKYMMAESELMRIRERTKAGMVQAAMNGYHANMAPYGYLNGRTEDKKPLLIPNEPKAAIVRKIFALALKGETPENIRRKVKEEGFHHTNKSAIQDILANAVYAGLIKVPAFKGRPSYLTKGKHIPLVAENDYWQLQGKGKTMAVQNKDEVPLRGVLHCHCGKLMTAGNSKNRIGKYYWYYLCGIHKQNFSAIKLHQQFADLLECLALSVEDVAYLRDKLLALIGASFQKRAHEVGATDEELKVVKLKILKTEEKYLSNTHISAETFDKVMRELKIRKGQLEKKLSELAADNQVYIDRMEILLPRLTSIRSAFDMMDLTQKQQFIRVIFGENLIYAENSYRTQFLHPFFNSKVLILKEKGLLIVQPLVPKVVKIRDGIGEQTSIELLKGLAKVLCG